MNNRLNLLLSISLIFLTKVGMKASGKSFNGNNEQMNERARIVVIANMGNEVDEMEQIMHR